MKRAILSSGLLIAVITLLSPPSYGQGRMSWRGGGWGPGSSYNRMFDPKTVETISGEVVSVDKITPMRGMSYGIHLMLKTDTGAISVHVGPAWYLDNQDTKITVGDKIKVTGSKIMFQGKPAIVASEITKGDQTLKLRDSNGYPLWSGWRRR